jgi:hypothetical protein
VACLLHHRVSQPASSVERRATVVLATLSKFLNTATCGADYLRYSKLRLEGAAITSAEATVRQAAPAEMGNRGSKLLWLK